MWVYIGIHTSGKLHKKNVHKQKIQVLLKLIIELQDTTAITFKIVSEVTTYQ